MEHDAGYPATLTPSRVGFIISNGDVSAMQRVIGTHSYDLRLPSTATFAVDAASGKVSQAQLPSVINAVT